MSLGRESPVSVASLSSLGIRLLLFLVAASSLAVLIAVGVARKEACSADIGSIERGRYLYNPCDLLSVGVGIASLAVVVSVSVALLRDPRLRAAAAVVGILAILLLVLFGLNIPSVLVP